MTGDDKTIFLLSVAVNIRDSITHFKQGGETLKKYHVTMMYFGHFVEAKIKLTWLKTMKMTKFAWSRNLILISLIG